MDQGHWIIVSKTIQNSHFLLYRKELFNGFTFVLPQYWKWCAVSWGLQCSCLTSQPAREFSGAFLLCEHQYHSSLNIFLLSNTKLFVQNSSTILYIVPSQGSVDMAYFLPNFGDILSMTHILESTEKNTPCQLNTFLTQCTPTTYYS